ncbi:hypothetical protein B0O80DRAFT_488204 [Mortierella sp. GBAus27b]|nr:hypothetical protein B0O80DRAFT_488204 [Mortierella sp. GBAus27b]
MFGRSLLSALAVAAVAIQACAASVLPPGKYEIKLGGLTLGTDNPHPGRGLQLDPYDRLRFKDWIILPNRNWEYFVRLDVQGGEDLWLAPLAKADHAPVELREQPIAWRLDQLYEDKFTVRRADDESLVLAKSLISIGLSQVETTHFRPGDDRQIWSFKPTDEEFGSSCGPKRPQRGSFYHQ